MSYISFLQQNLALHLPEKMTVCHIFDSLGPCCMFDFLRPFRTFYLLDRPLLWLLLLNLLAQQI